MKILLIDELDAALLNVLLSENIVYRPDLLHKSDELLLSTLLDSQIEAIVSSRTLPAGALNAWTDACRSASYYVKICPVANAAAVDKASLGLHPRLSAIFISPDGEKSPYVLAFEKLERISSRRLIARTGHSSDGAEHAKRDHVVLVGAGLVNLITAHTLQKNGYEVSFVDNGPDPRANAPWTSYGCSRGGDDARMFTLSEMDNYNDKQVSLTMNTLFNRPVSDLGWSVHWKDTLSAPEKGWIKEFESIPVWLANRYNEDIFAFNRESLPLWDDWKATDPRLFESSIIREDILRIYSDPAQFAWAVKRQDRIGATKRVLSPEALAKAHPGLTGAVRGGHIAGGVEVIGFTINAHKFIHQLLARLEGAGARFAWNQPAQSLLFDERGRVSGVRASDGVLDAVHYVVSPGAYGNNLLAGSRTHGRIHGVLGAWLRLPNTAPQLQLSMKLARKNHITEDSNITIATDVDGSPLLVIGSGYGHTGVDPRNIDQAQLHQIYQGLVDTAQKYFPQAYEEALAAGSLEDSFKYCVRPWTATSLGIFESIRTARGGSCVITGGHNTGGFTQAPATAQAVLAALEGRPHPMHAAYHPDRACAFLAQSTDALSRRQREEAELV
jgi:D-amino-acid dehydrogenase